MDRRDYASEYARNTAMCVEMFKEEFGHTMPMHNIVCPSCGGRGKYVNPGIDSHGLSYRDFAEDPDFEEAYWRGHYDMQCEECEGHNVVPTLNEAMCTPEQIKWYESFWNEYYDHCAEREAEMRAGC